MMDIDALREYYEKYCLEPTIDDRKEVLRIFAEFLLTVSLKNKAGESNIAIRDRHARLVCQMMMTKILHLKSALDGIGIESTKGVRLRNIIDPTIIGNMVRNIFETTSMFHMVYHKPTSSDEREISYLLWAISGLSYRQRFASDITAEENRKKLEGEKKTIASYIDTIKNTGLYQSLDSKEQEKILSRTRTKEYLIKFEGKRVKCFYWHETISEMGVQRGLFDNMYTYFSLFTHPSYVSVFQFGEMFNEGKYLDTSGLLLDFATFLSSIFIVDYIRTYPDVKAIFDQQPLQEQILLNFGSQFTRGDTYSITEIWKAVG